MPAFNNIWLIASPRESNADDEMAQDLYTRISGASAHSIPGTSASIPAMHSKSTSQSINGETRTLPAIGSVKIPEFKTGTLSSLITVSESLAKHDGLFTAVLGKIVDTIRSLDPNQLQRNLILDDGRPFEFYVLDGWQWNRAKFQTEGRSLPDLVESFAKDMSALDTIHKQKLGNYNLAKGQLQAINRKQTGNLATRDLGTVVDKDDVPAAIKSSEYLDIVYVAVPRNNAKDWESKYERLTQMVVPRSSVKVASDEEYILYTATIFKRVKEEFTQKCRDNKFTVRDFEFDEAAILKQQKELKELQSSERDQWAELLRISRINYSESLELLVHLKVVRGYVESVLRYGLPASYFMVFLKPDPKTSKKLLPALTSFFEPIVPPSSKSSSKKGSNDDATVGGEFASLMEAEVFDFVLFEVPYPDSLDGR